MPPDDTVELEELVERLRARDAGAFEALYDRTSGFLFGLILRIVRNRAVAEEVAQQVYLEIWRGAPAFDRGRGSAHAWMATIARSRALDRVRSDRSYGSAIDLLEDTPVEQPLGGGESDPGESAELAERRALVSRALGELPVEQRQAIELAFFGGRSHTEIAEALGVPLGTVKSRIRAAIDKLRRSLAPHLQTVE